MIKPKFLRREVLRLDVNNVENGNDNDKDKDHGSQIMESRLIGPTDNGRDKRGRQVENNIHSPILGSQVSG